MDVNHGRGFPKWQQALLLIVAGAIVGYVSFENLDIWGATANHFPQLWFLGFVAGAAAFISGFLGFLLIAMKALASSRASEISAASQPERTTHPTTGPRAMAARAVDGSISTSLRYLRIAVLATIIFEALGIWRWGAPSLASSYGRSYWLISVLRMLLTQVPFAVALVRLWPAADRPGLALAVVSSASLILFMFRGAALRRMIPLEPWPWLSVLSALAAVSLGIVVWSRLPRREGDAATALSITIGFITYTIFVWVIVAMLRARMHV
jgi:hypothetical protein